MDTDKTPRTLATNFDRPRTFMHCVDASSESLNAFKYLVNGLVNVSRGDNIILFSVQEEKESVSDVEERIAKFVRTLATLDQCLKLNQDGGVHYKVITVKESSAKKKIGQSIIATSEAEKADFLVMGSRSSSVTKTGSISNYVLKHSKIPVVVSSQ